MLSEDCVVSVSVESDDSVSLSLSVEASDESSSEPSSSLSCSSCYSPHLMNISLLSTLTHSNPMRL